MIAYLHILSHLCNKDDHSAVKNIVIQGAIEENCYIKQVAIIYLWKGIFM